MQVLEKQSGNVKALFRRSTAHAELGDLPEAQRDLARARELDPSSADLAAATKRLRARVKEADRQAKGLFGAMCAPHTTWLHLPNTKQTNTNAAT